MAMSATAQELLDAANEAILALLQGRIQEYQFGQRRFRYADLAELRRVRDTLKEEVSGESGTGIAFNHVQWGE